MQALISRTLRTILGDAQSSDIILLNGADHTILTKAAWPFLYSALYEIVVRRRVELALYVA